MNQLVDKGKVTRGWLGVTIQELTPELSQKFGLKSEKGALVGDVAKGSPAEKSGIKRGDIILEYNGKKISDVGNLRNMVAQSKVGSEIPITIMRAGKEYAVKVVIVELPKEIADATPGNAPEDSNLEGLSGLTAMELSREIARQLGLHKDEKGVVVVRVEAGSPAEEAGIRKGDVIQEIDRKRIEGLNDYNKAVSGVKQGDAALLFVNRGGKKFYVTIKPS
jgi:serine protease Do